MYCSDECRDRTRAERRRASKQLYWRSFDGRFATALRVRAYRERRAQNVTDTGRREVGPDATVSVPQAAAYSHSASVGRRPPSQTQNANAWNQVTQLRAYASLLPGVSVQVANPGESGTVVVELLTFQSEFHPLPGMSGCASAPCAGGAAAAPEGRKHGMDLPCHRRTYKL